MLLQIDKRLMNMKIVGLNKDTYEMSELISTTLKNMEKEEHERQQQALLAKAVQWAHGDETGQWTKYGPSVNKVVFCNFFY